MSKRTLHEMCMCMKCNCKFGQNNTQFEVLSGVQPQLDSLYLSVSWCSALYVLTVWCEVSQSSEFSSVGPTAAATTWPEPPSTECL